MVEDSNLVAEANAYQARYNKPPLHSVSAIPLDESLARETADYFEMTPHGPQNEDVKKSYESMKRDVERQWDYATQEMGVQLVPTSRDPYKNSEEMMKDVRENGRLYYYTGGDVPADHPLAAISPKTGQSYNNMFRAVHDLFGHATHGNQFGPAGERRAFIAHSQMMEPQTVPALAFETHAQNSWFNYGKHLRNEKGYVAKKGETGYIAPAMRPFPLQKANILPARLSAVENALLRARQQR